ncbi:Hypothetical predicted protein [Olea europaea subsp. europaea]|uniref:NFD4 C-terminal domain-containing protein n=1 Tax=Olea europaea subsp. europaea TaxID=158383 RepID=A0A8S0SL41_OLEEU|nr:Hypothetical predicted protein [Olea europaea subsp. europaea]
MAPLAIPLKMTLFPANHKKPSQSDSDDGGSTLTCPLLNPSSSAECLGSFYESEDISEVDIPLAVDEGAVKKKKKKPRRGEDFKFPEDTVKADFWLPWTVYFLGFGSGVTVLNNLAQIGDSLGVNDTTILLSWFSFCKFLGRLGSRVVSEYSVTLSPTLYAATALLGICYGAQFRIMIPTTTELFGLRRFGLTFNFMHLGNPAFAFLFSHWLAGHVYDTEAA